jgi:hypothetical protein
MRTGIFVARGKSRGGGPLDLGSASWRLIASGVAVLGALAVVLAIRNPSSPLAKLGAAQVTPAGSPIAAPVSTCTTPPRELPSLDATQAPDVAASPTTAATSVVGLADAQTVLAITTTVRESIACSNAGAYLQELSLFSDRYVRDLFTGSDAIDPAEFANFVATPPVPRAAEDQLALVAVRDVQFLADGRVSAIVVTRDADATYTDLLIFVRAGDRWLIDEFRPAPRPPATPISSPVASPAA